MKKILILNVFIIMAVVALTAGVTFAWFSAQDQSKQAEITTAELGIQGVFSSPLQFTNMLPGDSLDKWINIKNSSGTAKEDFYLQMIPESPGGDTNFCYKNLTSTPIFDPKVWLRIEDTGSGTVWYNNWICYLYPVNVAGEGGKVIVKIADDVYPGNTIGLKITLTLATSAGNGLQGKNNKDTINLIAVQYNGPAPQVVINKIWPDGDPNYQ